MCRGTRCSLHFLLVTLFYYARMRFCTRGRRAGFNFLLDTLFCFVWLLLLLLLLMMAVCAPPPHKSYFDRNSRDLSKFVGNQPELILQRTYREKELSFKVICEKLPTLFSRDGEGGYKIYSKRCFSDQSDCRTDFCKLLFNYLPNQ